jgi:hypothetical protein
MFLSIYIYQYHLINHWEVFRGIFLLPALLIFFQNIRRRLFENNLAGRQPIFVFFIKYDR